MIELLDKIETILAASPQPSDNSAQTENWPPQSEDAGRHPHTSWTSRKIVQSLMIQLPMAEGARESEAFDALRSEKYSRCKIYPQLVEGSIYIKAVDCMSRIPQAVETDSLTLSSLFKESARLIIEAHNQTIAAAEDEIRDNRLKAKETAIVRLEKLAIDVFARGLGDEAEK